MGNAKDTHQRIKITSSILSLLYSVLLIYKLFYTEWFVRAAKGDLVGAAEDFERTLKLNPDNANARKNLVAIREFRKK